MSGPPPLELLVGRPGGSPLVRAYLERDPGATAFFGRPYDDFASFAAKAHEVDKRFDRAARQRAVESVIVPPGADASRLDRFVAEGGYMVTTGQQPGLFGGPLYNVSKGLTCVRLARALEERIGKPVLPVFWVSSEDHDWEEASQASLVGVGNQVHTLTVPRPAGAVTSSIHRLPLGPESADVVRAFVELLPKTDFSAEYVQLLTDAFRPGATIGDGFHATMQKLLGRFGLFFTDGALPTVKRDSASILWAELARAAEMEGVLTNTARALEAAGYSLQVPILEGSVNLFLEGPAGRERVYRQDGGYRLRVSGEQLTEQQIRARVAADPRALSPNVLLRPVVESALFPTLAYVGGPGEIAYFGQLRAFFTAHGIEMPVVYPRLAATPVEGKIRKVLDKFGLDVPALDRPFHEIASDVAREEVPADVRAALGKLRGTIAGGVAELKRAATAVDKTLSAPVQQVAATANSALDDVEKKILQAVKRESEICLAQLEKAQVHLFPQGKPAERVQSPFYYLARYGGTLLDTLHDRCEVNLS
ncbi:MAG: bacillithiol biosynthesis cysteine-adding enzyme BshC [Gemmatimonadetes bacterium]|nr:bacillithiol biosynthesis cysteine-adding enzyme BshC [Gemmatimonadota bacterium]